MTDEEESKINKEEEITIEATPEGEDLAFSDKIKKIKEELEKCRKEKEEYLTGWQRAKADLINARKDDERRNQEFARFANASLISDLLAVLDSFDLAFVNEEKDSKFSKGVFLIKIQLEDILRKYGLGPIKTVGGKADLNMHEIVGEEKSDKEEGIIIEELQKGYTLYGKVLRPARVKVSKKI
jgi:molecular chaperone GrpE